MRPWMIVILGATGALLCDVAWMWPELAAAPHPDLALTVAQHLPPLVPGTLFLYAVLVLLLTTATIVLDVSRVRFRLRRLVGATRAAWARAFAGTGLVRLATRLLRLSPAASTFTSDTILVERPFEVGNARQEIARFYQDWLARGHFFTALALVLAAAAMGLA